MICTADIDFPHTNTREFRPFDGRRALLLIEKLRLRLHFFSFVCDDDHLWSGPSRSRGSTVRVSRFQRKNTRKKQEANLVYKAADLGLCLYFYAFNAYAMLTDWTASLSLYVVYINWISFLSSCVFILSHVATRTHLHFYSLTHQHSHTGRNLLCNFFFFLFSLCACLAINFEPQENLFH